jgi:hypothetical protein
MKILFKLFAICMLLITSIMAVSAIQFKPSGNIAMEGFNISNATTMQTTNMFSTNLNSTSTSYVGMTIIDAYIANKGTYNAKGISLSFQGVTAGAWQCDFLDNTTNSEMASCKLQVKQKGTTQNQFLIYPNAQAVDYYTYALNGSNVSKYVSQVTYGFTAANSGYITHSIKDSSAVSYNVFKEENKTITFYNNANFTYPIQLPLSPNTLLTVNVGMMYYNVTNKRPCFYNGTAWNAINGTAC